MPSIAAVSVLGTTGSHSASRKSATSLRMGLIFTNRTPASRHWRCRFCVWCLASPPGLIWLFLRANPPNATTSSQFPAISSHIGIRLW
jgi:hypothetical protein